MFVIPTNAIKGASSPLSNQVNNHHQKPVRRLNTNIKTKNKKGSNRSLSTN